jgi:hypothetical protein
VGKNAGFFLRKNDRKPCALLVPATAPYFTVDDTGFAGCTSAGRYTGTYKWQYR